MSEDNKTRSLVILAILAIGLGLAFVFAIGLSSPPIRPDAGGASRTPRPPAGRPPTAPLIDDLDYVQAPGTIRLGEGSRVGYAIEVETRANGNTSRTLTAIIGDTGEAWRIETNQIVNAMPQLEGVLLALEVRKSDGKVLKALAGKPGGALREVKVGSVYPSPEIPEGTEVEVTLSTPVGGPHKAKMIEFNGNKSYSGLEGELKGIALKYDAPQGSYELLALPETGVFEISGVEISATKLKLSNGSAFTLTKDPVAVALQPYSEGVGMLGLTTAGYTFRAITIVDDRPPALTWP